MRWFIYIHLILWIELAASAYVKGQGHHAFAREHRDAEFDFHLDIDSHHNRDCNEGEWRVKHGTNCKSFERCSNGQHETFHCPALTVWNQDIAACDDPHHVDIHTCTTNNHMGNVGSGSGHISTTTKSSHVAHHSYVHCGDGRCYHGSCSGSHSECYNNHCSSGYKCQCYHGYEGHSCELQKVSENHCQDNQLHCGHGYCVMDITDSTYNCHCNSYYTGKECDLHIVSENHCQDNKLHCGHGYCVMDITDSTYACHCYSDYTGKECDLHIVLGLYCQHHCQHGNCVTGPWSSSSHFCHCYDGYTGSHCDRHIASVSHVSAGPTPQVSSSTVHSTTHPTPHGTHCGHDMCYHGTCSPVRYCTNGACEHHHECLCYSDYEGDNCNLKRVSEIHCRTTHDYCHGHCVLDILDSKYTCRCSSGYTGEFCELRKVYDSHCRYYGFPCTHGYCVQKIRQSHYFCHCSHGYTGQKCDARAVSTTITTVIPSIPTASLQTTATPITPDPPIVHQTPSTSAPTTQSTTAPTIKSTSAPTTSSTPSSTTSSTAASTTTTEAATATGTRVLTSSTAVPSTSVPSTYVPSTALPSTTADATATGSTSSLMMSTTATPPTTTAMKIHYYTCDKLQTVMDLGSKAAINNTNTTSCPSGSFATPDAFVLGHCDTQMPPTWTKGTSVLNECHNIPTYTPVATFVSTAYNTMGGLSGIFLGCLPNGFKLAAQPCDGVPTIFHVENGGMFTMNPRLYYTVQ